MASSEDAVQYSLKDRLIRSEIVLYKLYETILPRKPRNLEPQRTRCNAKEAKATGEQFFK